jgi:hypothetical protein
MTAMQVSLFPSPGGLLVALLVSLATSSDLAGVLGMRPTQASGAFQYTAGVKETIELRLSVRQGLDVVQRLLQVHRLVEFRGPTLPESAKPLPKEDEAEVKLLLAHGHNLIVPSPPPKGIH